MKENMYVLGISALYHDSAAAITCNGLIMAAVQEERFTRKKHDNRLPVNSIEYCLREANIAVEDLDAVVYYENPMLSLDRVIQMGKAAGVAAVNQTTSTLSSLLSKKIWIENHLRHILGRLGKDDRLLYTEHHMSHAASAFYPSPFKEAAILTLDGVGEWVTTTIGYGKDKKIDLIREIHYPHSLGLLYSAFTMYCGFRVNSGEYKLMGLAPYGKPVFADLIKEHLIDIKPDGSFRLNMSYFDYLTTDRMVGQKFENLFGEKTRTPESDLTFHHMDIAASIQVVTEEIVLLLAKHAKKLTGAKNIVLAGGVALNCVANGKIVKENIFDGIWIQPAAGDAGGALGAALLVTYQDQNQVRNVNNKDFQKGSLLGPEFSEKEIQKYLDNNNLIYSYRKDDNVLFETIADELAKGKIIGNFSGRVEYGPRALGNRSILGDPRKVDMQSKLNLKIKYRESFRPFAPSVLLEDLEEYFDLPQETPYMQFVAPVQEKRRKPFDLDVYRKDTKATTDIVNAMRSDIPAVTHIDYSARIQTVDAERNPRYYNIINTFRKKTRYGLIVNTSFNVRGEPIVCTPQDAVRCFMKTEMDILVLENFILYKSDQLLNQFYDKGDEEYELD